MGVKSYCGILAYLIECFFEYQNIINIQTMINKENVRVTFEAMKFGDIDEVANLTA